MRQAMDLAVAGRPRACALDTLTRCAAVAQWIEHLPPKERVAGSIPASRTSLPVIGIFLLRLHFPVTSSVDADRKMTRQPTGAMGLFIWQESCASGEQVRSSKASKGPTQQVCVYPLAQYLSATGHAETVQLTLKSLGWRGVPADFCRPPTCPQSMHLTLCITCG